MEHRQGRSQRTDEDYARLANAYLLSLGNSRAEVARAWEARFGREVASEASWRNRLSDARCQRYIERDERGVERLTHEAMDLIHGDNTLERVAVEDAPEIEATERHEQRRRLAKKYATMKPGDTTWRQVQADGSNSTRLQEQARAWLAEHHPSE